jgi:Zn finger protein HypA/HybF involved in hydrogenase expression
MSQLILSKVPYKLNHTTTKYSYKTFVMDCNKDTTIETIFEFLKTKTNIPVRYYTLIIGKIKINYIHRFKFTFDELFENDTCYNCKVDINPLADKLQFEKQKHVIENEKKQDKIKSYIFGIYLYHMNKLQKFNPIKSQYFKLFSKYCDFIEDKYKKLILQDLYDYENHYNYPPYPYIKQF